MFRTLLEEVVAVNALTLMSGLFFPKFVYFYCKKTLSW